MHCVPSVVSTASPPANILPFRLQNRNSNAISNASKLDTPLIKFRFKPSTELTLQGLFPLGWDLTPGPLPQTLAWWL